jgi:hypothetical protein
MNSNNIFTGILFGVFISSCSNTPPPSTPNSITIQPDTIAKGASPVILHLAVLDCNLDTIEIAATFEMDSLFSSDEFKSEGYYTISYEEFQKLNAHITNQSMAQYRVQKYINQLGQIALIKRDFKKSKFPKFKYNYVQNFNWLKVNATQIGANLMCCGICSNEVVEMCNEAIKNNYSYAEMEARWQLKYEKAIPIQEYMKQAKDSVFTKGYYEDTYYFTYGKEQEYSFFIHDLGIIADINGDGYADRVASWSYNASGGICAVSKKSPKGMIQLLEFEIRDGYVNLFEN